MNSIEYKSRQDQWARLATIRQGTRRVLPEGEQIGYLFPPAHQPLCGHPRVAERGEDAKRFILTQSAYYYMNDVGHVETETINAIALRIANGTTSIDLPEDVRYDALTIIIDEAYHAYVARDFIRQVRERTGIEPIMGVPRQTELSKAMALFRKQLPEEAHPAFELIAACIGENTLTQDILDMARDESVSPFIDDIMKDHVRDEGRHCVLFISVLAMVWAQISDEHKTAIGNILPEFVWSYMRPELYIQFCRNVLQALGFDAAEAADIVKECYPEPARETLRQDNPTVNHLMGIFERCGLFEHAPTRQTFQAARLLD